MSPKIDGLRVIEHRVHTDDRGWFREVWRASESPSNGLPPVFAQDNISWSRQGVLRGLHLQVTHTQGKLVSAFWGEIFDVAVDLRLGSPTFGAWEGHRLSPENGLQLFIPAGFAHGFLVLSETALISYKCTDEYHPGSEITLRWDDPDLGVCWPIPPQVISRKDREGLSLAAVQVLLGASPT